MNINIGVLGLLGIVFVTLKLLGIIQWSWLWILAPFWIGFAITFCVLIMMAFIALVMLIASLIFK